ncbi:MAG: acetyl-CoA carboxylase, carboxyltransferase subunit beta [Vampirovibrionales bacterium]|nr:acetyl-CoA carboxylase, carboxyltransferase subunit beta [Vampirovibrionales bacterium]
MPIKDWFQSKRKQPQLDAKAINNRLSDEQLNDLWTKCYGCQSNLPKKELEANLQVCTKCGYHFRIGSRERIAQLCDDFHELDANLLPADPLDFEDTQKYSVRQKEAREKSELNEAIVTGIARINNQSLALGIMDFGYMGGSMGSVVGEKITRLAEVALEKQLPLVLFSSSGGARMQEGTFSLMQMVKTGAVLSRLHEAGLLYISVLTEPTFGGVTASYGMLGDVIIAEEGARVGFAGRRVIEQTIRQKLPSDFQTSGYLLKYGQIDMETKRADLKQTLSELLRLHTTASNKLPAAYEALVS